MTVELAVCHHYRIPHSEFLSWSQADRDKAIWQHIRVRQTCRNCGTRPEEWDPERGGHRHAFIPEKERCAGCEVLDLAEESRDREDGRGVRIVLIRNREVTDGRT